MTQSALQRLTTLPAPSDSASGARICNQCAHRCTILSGRIGLCGVVANDQGTLRSLVYGQAAVQHADPIERKPLYHVYPDTHVFSLGTPGCNMHCTFCQNWRLSQADLAHYEQEHGPVVTTSPERVVSAALEQGCQGIAFTYNEPGIYLDYAIDIMRLAKQAGLYTVFKSNGYFTPEAIDLLDGLLDAINIDLKGFDDGYYRKVCGAMLQPVCAAIAYLHQCGVWIEVSTLIIPGLNDSDTEVTSLVTFLATISPTIPWHVWRFHPDYQMLDRPWTHVHDIERIIQLGREAGLRYIYASNIPGDPHQHTLCPGCNTLLIKRTGNATEETRLHGNRCIQCGYAIPGIFETSERRMLP